MSNNGTYVVNLCRDPETLELGGRECMKLRVADNTGPKNETRFFGAVLSGPDVDKAKRLGSGDTIALTGQLVATSYKAKKDGKGVKKGQTIFADEMPFARILTVIKSKTFFEEQAATEAPPDAPEVEAEADVDPLADL